MALLSPGCRDLRSAAEEAAAAEDLVAVEGGVQAQDVRVVEEVRLLGALVGRLQWCDEVVAERVVDEDAHGEVADEGDDERGGRASPDRRRARAPGASAKRV